MPMLSEDELERFRTKFCTLTRTSGCEFGSERCNYSHNDYWPRRCPFYLKDRSALRYVPVCCPEVKLGRGDTVMESKCSRGGHCPFAHSAEEIWYHPLVYKVQMCDAYRRGECDKYYCPRVHGLAEQRCPKCYNLPYCRGVNIPQFPGVTIVEKLKSPSVRRGGSGAAVRMNASTSTIGYHYTAQAAGGVGSQRQQASTRNWKKNATPSPAPQAPAQICFDETEAVTEGDRICVVSGDWNPSYGTSGIDENTAMEVHQGDVLKIWVNDKLGWLYCHCIRGSNINAEGWVPASVVHELPLENDSSRSFPEDYALVSGNSAFAGNQSAHQSNKNPTQQLDEKRPQEAFEDGSQEAAAMLSLITSNENIFSTNDFPFLLSRAPEDSRQETCPLTKKHSLTQMDPSTKPEQILVDFTASVGAVINQGESSKTEALGSPIGYAVAVIRQLIENLEVLSSCMTISVFEWTVLLKAAFELLGAVISGLSMSGAKKPVSAPNAKLKNSQTVVGARSGIGRWENSGGTHYGDYQRSKKPLVSDEEASAKSTSCGNSDAWMDWKIVCPDLLSTLDPTTTEDVFSQLETSNPQDFCDVTDQFLSQDLFSSLFSYADCSARKANTESDIENSEFSVPSVSTDPNQIKNQSDAVYVASNQ